MDNWVLRVFNTFSNLSSTAENSKLYICGFTLTYIMKQTRNQEFVTVALPRELIDRLDKCIKNSNQLYTSRPHLIKIALAKFFKNNGDECGNEGESGRDGSSNHN